MNPILDTSSADKALFPHGSGICYKPIVRPLPPGCYVSFGWGACPAPMRQGGEENDGEPIACGQNIGTIGYRTTDGGPVVCERCANLKGKKK